jgi:integrase
MPRRATPLTVRQCETLGAGMHADGGGLYLRVSPTDARSWIFRYTLGGKRRDMGLGNYPLRTLAAARLKAEEAARTVLDGGDPLDAKVEQRAAAAKARIKLKTFEEAARQYIETHKAAWSNPKHAWQWTRSLEMFAFPTLGSIPVAEISASHVLDALKPIWGEKTTTASRVRGRIELVIGSAIADGTREDTRNPATWSLLKHLLPKPGKIATVEHLAAAAIDDMPGLYAKISAVDTMAAQALRFTILTASRTNEALGATWDEIDLGARLWTIPGDRMKAGRPHRVPLSDAAMAILREMAKVRIGDYVFQGQKAGQPLGGLALLRTLSRLGRADLTAHGFRSTFRDWCAERTDAPSEVAEMALAHVVGNKVEAAYRRGDMFEKRRELANRWAQFCTLGLGSLGLGSLGAGSNVRRLAS